jgi:hypothetical protein
VTPDAFQQWMLIKDKAASIVSMKFWPDGSFQGAGVWNVDANGLVAEHGASMLVTELLRMSSADCPKRIAGQ